MGSGDGRPGTPGPRDGGGAGGGEGKATYSGAVVIVGIISFVLGVIAVAVPYWGLFRPHTGKYTRKKPLPSLRRLLVVSTYGNSLNLIQF